jgi:hypothetical protein
LSEDWTTCLAEDRSGLVWLGHRQKGFEARDPRTGRAAFASSKPTLKTEGEDYVRATRRARHGITHWTLRGNEQWFIPVWKIRVFGAG